MPIDVSPDCPLPGAVVFVDRPHQIVACTRDARPDGADRASADIGGLGVGEAEDLGQYERFSAVVVDAVQQ